MKENTFDFAKLRSDFPLLKQTNRGKPIVYLDTAASAQKPQIVIDTLAQFYERDYANIHRGIYELSQRATRMYEESRELVKHFIHAAHHEEIVFTSGTTAAVNLVAQAYGRTHFQAGDEIILSVAEHHSNLVPWYLLKEQIGIELKVIPISDNGALDLVAYKKLFSPRTKLVAVTHASNVLGVINPIKDIITIAHDHQVPVLVDGAQTIAHMPINVQELDCDFYAFSAHKVYGPTGVGVLYAKKAILESMPPYQGGGNMIESVSFAKTTFAKIPLRFEAGTPDFVGVVGLAAALRYVQSIGMQRIYEHDQELLAYAQKKLTSIAGLHIIGTATPKVGVISFVIDNMHPHDIGTVLDHEGIAIRAGHHCAMPLMERFQIPATVRASFGVYNNEEDVDALVAGVSLAKRLLG